jgi:enoyl-CoA hydratase/carnithine racemase
MLTGRLVDAPAALDAGLVRSLHAPDELLPAAYELAREISDNAAPVSAAMTRQLLWRMLSAESPEDAHRAESVGLASRSRSADAREGVEAFLAKRAPEFPGRVSVDYVNVFDE